MSDQQDSNKHEVDIKSSPLYSEDLAPIPLKKRSWSRWHLAAIWVGMAVCIPTYLLASYMIKTGLNWYEALIIIGVANIIITVPMVLNGHAGVKYGIPFPVLGRAAFGTLGVHLASVTRGLIACGWFGVQTWIGGLAIYAIYAVLSGTDIESGLSIGKFVGFGIFWCINMYFIYRGTESIKWLEMWSAPILIGMGLALIYWGYNEAGDFKTVLDQSHQLKKQTAVLETSDENQYLFINPITDKQGLAKANEFKLHYKGGQVGKWRRLIESKIDLEAMGMLKNPTGIQLKKREADSVYQTGIIKVEEKSEKPPPTPWWNYLLWLTAMVGFWATMSISIADITRYAATQKDQVIGQFTGLPLTMMLYSFVGIFVTCAAVINFDDVLAAEEAPWDPVSLLTHFESPVVIIMAQIFMIIATLSTNIAANVIAPANAFSNVLPKKIDFKTGGLITGIIGILIAPWWLLDSISGFLIFVSGLLGPVLGIMLADYFLIRKKQLQLNELFKVKGIYSYGNTGFNRAAMIALAIGVITALIGYWVPWLNFLYSLSWFTGFIISFALYYLLMKKIRT